VSLSLASMASRRGVGSAGTLVQWSERRAGLAWLVRTPVGGKAWLPKSQVGRRGEDAVGRALLIVPGWLWRKNGFA
jgi:hypothetical protein